MKAFVVLVLWLESVGQFIFWTLLGSGDWVGVVLLLHVLNRPKIEGAAPFGWDLYLKLVTRLSFLGF